MYKIYNIYLLLLVNIFYFIFISVAHHNLWNLSSETTFVISIYYANDCGNASTNNKYNIVKATFRFGRERIGLLIYQM